MKANRTRKNSFLLYFTDEEMEQLKSNMAKLRITNREYFCRKMVLERQVNVVNIDTAPIKKIVSLLGNATNNINQIAKKANESSVVNVFDIIELSKEVEKSSELALEAYKHTLDLR